MGVGRKEECETALGSRGKTHLFRPGIFEIQEINREELLVGLNVCAKKKTLTRFYFRNMEHLTSTSNPLFKRLVRIAAGKRDKDNTRRVILEGVHLCEAWLDQFGQPEIALFDSARMETSAELRSLQQRVDAAQCRTCDPRLAKSLSQVEQSQGVFFLVATPAPELPERIDENCLWLDRIQDPGNVGTLLRTAAAAGIRQVFLSEGCCAVWSAKVLRSAQGAHFLLKIHENAPLSELQTRLTIPLIATDVNRGATSLFQTTLPQQCAWIFGNEGQGVDPALLALAELRVFIPQAPAVESLNVGIAAGICIFEQTRQHPRDL